MTTLFRLPSLLAGAVLAVSLVPMTAGAFSQFGGESGETPPREGIVQVPLPPLRGPSQGTSPQPVAPAGEAQNGPASGPTAPALPGAPSAGEPPAMPTPPAGEDGADATSGPPPEILYGDADLPPAVRELRTNLIEIAKSGDIEKLRPYLRAGDDGTVLSFGETPDDPVDFLKSASGDGEGVEMLAIMLEILQSGHVATEKGTADEIYVWPYFSQMNLEQLSKPQMVELFELVTAGDYEAMKEFGAYNFYRIGLAPNGKLEFFVAGD